jgi:Signal transduction histidine kinase
LNQAKKIKLLYIDDEVNNLNSFKASFRFDYNVLLAASPAEAMQILAQHDDISVILSDQRMPDQTGVEFFEEVRQIYPNPVRILITGFTDIESVISAVNRGHIFRYLKKPWSDVDLQSAIEEANKFYVTSAMLHQKNEELQKAYTELDKFAYSATHDMRGPIMSVLGIISIAKDTKDKAEVDEMLDMMEKAMMKLDNYIQSLHDYYNIRRGGMQLTNIDLNGIVKDLHDIFDVTSRVDNVKFNAVVVQNERFRSDETSIKIILNNLLSNAFKYQRKDIDNKEVNLHLEIKQDNLEIVVSDNGIGIPNDSLGHIFNMFYRAASHEFGSGFGLYNVKDALGKINGKIEVVESKVNEGTVFKVIIPRK